MVQERLSGNASEKRNCWYRGHGPDSMRGELKRGLSLNRKTLNRKVRHQGKDALQHRDYKRVCRTLRMVDFT